MSLSMNRRAILWSAMAVPVAAAVTRAGMAAPASNAETELAALEKTHGGRLGVTILDGATGARSGHRQNERFAMCSTFKFVLAGLVLSRVDAGQDKLDLPLPVPATGLIHHSPVSQHAAGSTMTLSALCRATMTTSDNTAANVLITHLGGPSAITTFARSLGDEVTRLDRMEPEMNLVSGADERDTTSPPAMAQLMATLVLGDALSSASREILVGWLCATRTGLTRLQAGMPDDWLVGDKTGTGPDGPTNDILVAWPHTRAPLIVTAYYERPGYKMAENAKILAEVGRIAAASFA